MPCTALFQMMHGAIAIIHVSVRSLRDREGELELENFNTQG